MAHREADYLQQIASQLHTGLCRENGATVDPATCKPIARRAGYLVSLARFGDELGRKPSMRAFEEWVFGVRDLLLIPDGAFFPGGWRHPTSGIVFVDLNRLVRRRDNAFAIGLREGQHSIRCLWRGNDIPLLKYRVVLASGRRFVQQEEQHEQRFRAGDLNHV